MADVPKKSFWELTMMTDQSLRRYLFEQIRQQHLSSHAKANLMRILAKFRGTPLRVLYLLWQGEHRRGKIAKKLGITEARVSQIIKHDLKPLRDTLMCSAGVRAFFEGSSPVSDRAGRLVLSPDEKITRYAQAAELVFGDDLEPAAAPRATYGTSLRDWERKAGVV